MKNYKKISTINYICSLLWYLATIITFLTEHELNSMGVMYLCLGSTFLCLGSVCYNKSKSNDENDKEDKK